MAQEVSQKEQEQNQEVVQQDVRSTAPVEAQKGVEVFLQQINDIPTVPTNVKNIAKQQAVSNSDNSNLATNQTQSSSNQSNSSSTSSENLGVRIVKKNSLEADVNADLRDPMSSSTQARVVEKNNLEGNVVADLRLPVYEHKEEAPKTEYRATPPPEGLLTISNIIVNEGSPYAVFTVSGKASQGVSLALGGQNSDGHDLTSLEYFNGNSWQTYISGNVPLDSTGKLLVRVALSPEQETALDGPERFNLIATNRDGISSTGTGTIKDDGTGSYFAADNNTGVSNVPNGVVLDDDRPLSVNNVSVNEASPYAVFEVSGVANQKATLSLQNVTTTGLSGLKYFDGTNWQTYNLGDVVSLNSDGKLLVRISLTPEQETAQDNGETFTLTATNTGGTSSIGTATIHDDGTGTYYPDANPVNNTPATDPTHILDNDGPLSINDVSVNEASPYAVFTISGTINQIVSLSLQNETTTALSSLEYFDGTSWQPYTSGNVNLDSNGELLVRVALSPEQESTFDGPETFNLIVTNTGGGTASGTGTIYDDGIGDVFLGNNNSGTPNNPGDTDPNGPDYPANLDDDRVLSVNNISVNEASPYAVFTVTGGENQKVQLELVSGTATLGTDTHNAGTGVPLQYFDGTNWVNYDPNSYVLIPNGGTTLLVRTAITQDSTYEGAETFTLNATNTGGTSATGTGTIKDDGTGDIFLENNNSGTPNVSTDTGYPANLDDDRILHINNIDVNEGSPYAIFTVTGIAGQSVKLTLTSGTATLETDTHNAGTGVPLQYFDGTNWVNYDPNSYVLIPNGGTTLLVRTSITQDSIYEGAETFKLTATNISGTNSSASEGNATIHDDGTGQWFSGTNGTGSNTAPSGQVLDDDRALSVNNISINEGSSYGVFTVTGIAGQNVKLSLTNGTATGGTTTPTDGTVDYGTSLEYYNGSGWSSYSPNSYVSIPNSGTLLVRTAILNDTLYEGAETFKLVATNTGGTSVNGIGIIHDDGTGQWFDGTSGTGSNTAPSSSVLNDDRVLTVADVNVNEASPYAVFEITAEVGERISLSLTNGTATGVAIANKTDGTQDFTTGLQYWNGSAWTAYNSYVTVGSSGTVLVRNAIINDTLSEGAHTYTLNATYTNGASRSDSGTATIKDDGTGDIFLANNNTSTPNDPADTGYPTNLDDDRALSVNNISVNEGSTYAVFTVTGAVGQVITLSLADGTATGVSTATLTDGTQDYVTTMEYWDSTANSGAGAWTTYTSNLNITIDSTGKVFVRNTIINDTIQDNGETFKLIATNTGSGNATGTATIYDDGTGVIYTGNISTNTPATNSGATLNNDGTLKVNNVDVNEGSPYAVFTVSGTVGDSLVLTLTNGTAGSLDYSSTLQYWDSTANSGAGAWLTYSSSVIVPTGGTLLVRTAIVNDTTYEGAETFTLKALISASTATATIGGSAIGTGTIHDDGTGTYFPDSNPTNSTTPATDSTHLLDDDRVIGISTLEDTNYTFSLSDFGSYSSSYSITLDTIKILTLPTDGIIYLNGTAISADTAISTSDISSGKLTFVPTAQTDVDSTFTFQMGNGTTYVISNTMNVNITAVADMPSTTLTVGTNTGQFVDSSLNAYASSSTSTTTTANDTTTATFTNIKTGVVYSTSFDYIDSSAVADNGKVDVYWGGSLVATINGDKTTTSTLTLDLVGGAGNGSNQLKFISSGTETGTMSISNIIASPSQNMLEYNVNLSAALNTADRADGSETLSIKLSGYPQGTTFSVGYAETSSQWDPVLNTNTDQPTGNWIIPLSAITDDTYANGEIKMYVPESAETFTLTSTAIATEANDNSTATAIATSSVVDYSLNVAPTSTNDSVTTLEDTTYTFTVNDFGTYADDYNTAHPGLTSFTSIMITSLPTNGTLRLYGHDKFGSDADVQVGDQILVTDLTLGNLVFIPNSQYSGSAGSIGFQVGDGKVYSTSSYATTVSVTAVADMPSISISIGTAVAPNASINTKVDKVITESFGSSSSSNIGSWSSSNITYSNVGTSNDFKADGTTTVHGTADTGYVAAITPGKTVSVTYSGFTPGSTVTIKFSSDAESNNNWSGKFYIKDLNNNNSNSNTIYYTKYRTSIDSDVTNSTYNGSSITAKVNSSGDVKLSFTNGGSEKIDIDQLVITGTETITATTSNIYTYPITITDSLGADTDGSETLGNVPLTITMADTTLSSVVLNVGGTDQTVHLTNGVGTYNIAQNQLSNITLKVPSTATSQAFSLTASVTSTESSNGDSKIATATAEHSTADTTPVTTNAVADLVTTSSTGSGSSPTNIVVIMDVSGSMSTNDGTGARLALAKTAINNMIDSYSAIGTVNVNLTSFQATATSYGWQNATAAKTAINALASGGYTNYEDAVYKTYTGYTDINSSAKTIVLFVSDGEPTRENLEGRDVTGDIGLDAQSGWLDTPYLDAWKTFINTYADELKVVGIGAGLTNMTYLDQLAQGINNSVVTDVVHLTNTADLATYVAPNVDSVYGNVLHNIDYKADGAGGIQSIVVNGTTYHSNVSSEVTALTNGVNTKSSGEYGKLTFDFTTGDYKYTTANATTTDRTESFAITVADSNGTQSTFNLKVQVFNSSSDHTYVNSSTAIDAGSGYDSLILGSGINIDFSTNQSLSNFEQIDLLKNGDHTLSNINLQDIVSMTDSNNLLSILGDSADTISLKNTSSTVDVWSKSNTSPDANNFDTYINSGNNSVSLKIDHDIHVSII